MVFIPLVSRAPAAHSPTALFSPSGNIFKFKSRLRLANWADLNVTADDLGNLRLAVMALLPNLAGIILCFGAALRRGAALAAPGDQRTALS